MVEQVEELKTDPQQRVRVRGPSAPPLWKYITRIRAVDVLHATESFQNRIRDFRGVEMILFANSRALVVQPSGNRFANAGRHVIRSEYILGIPSRFDARGLQGASKRQFKESNILKSRVDRARKRKYRCGGRFETDSVVLHGGSAGRDVGSCVCSSPGTDEHARTIPATRRADTPDQPRRSK